MSKTRKSNEQYYSSHDKSRSISNIINSVQTTEGEGFLVNRAFPNDLLLDLDPFLLLDEVLSTYLQERQREHQIIPTVVLKLLLISLRVSSNIRTQEVMQER